MSAAAILFYMKLLVANTDVSGSLGADIAAAAKQRAQHSSPHFHVSEVSALSLRNCSSEDEYFSRFIKLMRMRHGASTDDFEIQRAPGFMGAIKQRIRRFLWKLLAYQHDRMIFQQNLINEMIIHAIEFEVAERNKQLEKLTAELAEIKRG
jgi:hypothetical protein